MRLERFVRLALAFIVLSPSATAGEPTAKAAHRAGQTFITWREVEGAKEYRVYRAAEPIRDPARAACVGSVDEDSTLNFRAAAGEKIVAVSGPVSERVAMPEPVPQGDERSYVHWVDDVGTAQYPAMGNRASYAFNFVFVPSRQPGPRPLLILPHARGGNYRMGHRNWQPGPPHVLVPDDERGRMCRAAMEAAKRDAEKKLVLEVLKRYPSIDTLRLAVEAAKVPSLKDDAARVSVVIAGKIGGSSADVQRLLAQVGQEPVKVEIVKAEYGAGKKFADVTEVLRRHVRGMPLVVLPSPSYNASFGGDPVPNVVKQLKVQYRINGKAAEATFPENATIMLPIPK